MKILNSLFFFATNCTIPDMESLDISKKKYVNQSLVSLINDNYKKSLRSFSCDIKKAGKMASSSQKLGYIH
jgi:hypothetical protein